MPKGVAAAALYAKRAPFRRHEYFHSYDTSAPFHPVILPVAELIGILVALYHDI